MSVVATRRIPTSGGDLAVIDVGEGPAVVLIHGFPLSSFLWRRFIPSFGGRFRVVAPDLLGSGDSDKPAGARLDIRAQARYVHEVLDALGVERFAVVGHGSGGGVAQRLALDGAGVSALVLMDTVAFDEWPAGRASRIDVDASEQEHAAVETQVRSWLDAGMRSGRALDADVVDAYVRPFTGPGGAQSYARGVRALDGLGLRGHEAAFAGWEFPVFILWGEDDPYFPVEIAERLSDAIPASTLAVLPGCGHLLPEEAPETVAPLIAEYLRARYLGKPHAHEGEKEGLVMLQLERRPPWVDLEEDERDDWFDVDDAGDEKEPPSS